LDGKRERAKKVQKTPTLREITPRHMLRSSCGLGMRLQRASRLVENHILFSLAMITVLEYVKMQVASPLLQVFTIGLNRRQPLVPLIPMAIEVE